MLDAYFPLYATVFFISLLFTALIEKRMIPLLSRNARQPIYDEGPKWHLKKSGTPTMGGLAFLVSISISLIAAGTVLLLGGDSDTVLSLTLCILYSVANAAVGIIDDAKKLKQRKNKGLSAKQKLILQFLLAAAFLLLRKFLLNEGTSIAFSFGEVEFGIAYYPLAAIVSVGIINCANLTDGIDGLASSVAFSVGVSLLYLSAALNTEASAIASAIIGASIGFLCFNLHPAKIFMGDTGSLYFGSLIACSAFSLKNPIIIVFIAGVYVIEGCSVILQVLYYKLFGRRIFKMAPIHHHLEQYGFSENRICIIAIILTFIFSIPAYIFYLP